MAAVLAFAGCEENPLPQFDITWSGEHLDFGTTRANSCAGTLPYMDDYAGALAALWGEGATERATYYYIFPEEMPRERACPPVGGCTLKPEDEHPIVYVSSKMPHEHELVHAMKRSLSQPVIEEGVAELYGDDAYGGLRGPPSGSLEHLLGVTRNDAEHIVPEAYTLGGSFAAYLRSTYGDETVVAVADAIPRGSSAAHGMAVLDEHLGLPFPTIEQEFADADVQCEQHQYRAPPLYCADADFAVLTPWCVNGESQRIIAEMGCENERTIGPLDGELWQYYAVEMPRRWSLNAMTPDPEVAEHGYVEVQGCGSTCGAALGRAPILHEDEIVLESGIQGEAGRYVLRVTVPQATEGAWIELRLNTPDCRISWGD